jgi:hypothetical protein
MTEPLFQMLDAVNIDEGRQYIEFQFSDYAGERKIIQIDFDCLESLTGVLRQASISAGWKADKAATAYSARTGFPWRGSMWSIW